MHITRWLWHLAPVAGLALAGFLIHRTLRGLSLAEIVDSLHLLAARHVGLAIALTMGSYAVLTGFDTAGVRYTRHRLPYGKIAFTSFLALSIGHTLGVAALSSGAIRWRLYTVYGLSTRAVAQIVMMCALTVVLGLASLAGISAVASPRLTAEFFHLTPETTVVLGGMLLSVGAIYLILTAVRPTVRIRGHALRLPSFHLALGQLAVGTLDFLLVAGVLHQLLIAAGMEVAYLTVAMLYSVATIAAIIAHVPGGIGVTEAVVLSLLPSARAAGALLVFRVVYYLVPFLIGCALLAAFEVSRYRLRHSRSALPNRAGAGPSTRRSPANPGSSPQPAHRR